MKKKFLAIVLITVAYVTPMVAAYTLGGHNVNVFWGVVPLTINYFVFFLKHIFTEDYVDDALLYNSTLTLVVGLIFTIMIAITASASLGWLALVILIASIIFCGMF